MINVVMDLGKVSTSAPKDHVSPIVGEGSDNVICWTPNFV
jgi:hypothetical protein